MNEPKEASKPSISSHRKPYHEMSLLDFQDQFPDDEACYKYFIQMRWSDGFRCPKCSSTKNCLKLTRRIFECYDCKKQTAATAGKIFHKSKIPLRKWFWAIFLISTNKKGVSMLYLQKQLGIKNYRTIWLMGHKIRQAMIQRDALYSLQGTVQADEIFIGGKQSLHDRRQQGSNKTSFLIAVEESGAGNSRFVTFEELETIYEEHVLPALQKHLKKGSKIKSDGAGVYVKAGKQGYEHDRVVTMKNPDAGHDHLKWVNTLTSNLKRFLLSTYHGVKPKYRKAYLEEFAYRFNRRYWPHQAFDRLFYACISAHPIPLREITT